MNEKLPHAIREGALKIGDVELRCAVLNNETRVLTQKTFLQAIGRSRPRGGEAQTAAIGGLPFFLASPSLNSFISEGLRRSASPVLFRPLTAGGRQTAEGGKGGRGYALGFDARILPEVCKVFVEARDKGQLSPALVRVAERCDRLLRGLAGVGIIALIDEATGYQYDRDRAALRQILEAYVNPELLPWSKRFPAEFYKQLFRLQGWQYSPVSVKRPVRIAQLTAQLIYEQLPPGVLDQLRRVNPTNEKGLRRHKHHQFLTDNIGNPHLEKQLVAVTTLMRAAPNWTNFERMFRRAFPSKQGELALIEREPGEPSSLA